MSLQNNAGFTEFRPAPQNAPAQIQNVGNGHFTATPVHPNLVDSHIRDPKSQGSRLENQNQFQNQNQFPTANAVGQGSRFESGFGQPQVF